MRRYHQQSHYAVARKTCRKRAYPSPRERTEVKAGNLPIREPQLLMQKGKLTTLIKGCHQIFERTPMRGVCPQWSGIRSKNS